MNHLANFDLITLFFVLGAVGAWIKSDLEVPEQISKFLSIFLLLSLGLKGGHEVRFAENLMGFGPVFALGLASCFVIPSFVFLIFKSVVGFANASAIAASYGSVSAVTFISTQSFLDNEQLKYNGFMVAVMALM